MGIHIFNPPDPTSEPAQPGDSHGGCRKCGSCVSVPKYWQLDAPGSAPGVPSSYFGRFRLDRLNPFAGIFANDCEWQIAIDPTSFLGGPGLFWSLWYGSFSGTLTTVGWHVLMQSPPSALNFFAHYYIGAGGSPPVHFNCLKPNTFPLLDGGLLSPNFPQSVTVTPLWP